MNRKIIFNSDSLIMGGAEKIALEYINLLSESRNEVLLLINEDNGKEKNILLDMIPKNIKYKYVIDKRIIEKLNYYKENKKENIFYKLMYNYFLIKRRQSYRKNIIKILKEENYDYLIDFYCKIPKEVIDDRAICWLHMTLKNISNKNKLKYRKKFLRCKNIVVLNEDMKEEFEKIFPESFKKVRKIYNFFDIDKIKKLSLEIDTLKKEEKLLIKNNFIVACCRLDRQKDIDTLIEAYEILKKKYKRNEKLYILGEGSEKERLEKKIRMLNLEKEIIFLGTKLNPYIWMKNAKLFIHSSFKEGFGMVIVEAMIVNGIVISTDCPVGPREILENGKSGILVEIQNKEQMAQKIMECLIDENLRKKLKNNSLYQVENFSKTKALIEVEKLFNNS
ncbi:glycosyltransferase [Fusobacterium varium]|uniref:glycosyltransferase n=1 Tax=Fusobacterium varium TaxID=856 RepID=UPI001F3608AD|nr:glycosyltransferase [Fusobacterium varium]MCF2672518.1 glycosyltransferase [Fusobacterium varium]